MVFRSPRDGARIDLTPERSMAIQMTLGADVAMAFDQCPPYPASESEVAAACRRTHAWLERCISSHTKADQALFGIVQGGCFPHLREESARVVSSMGLPGIAVGGVSVGEPAEEMHRIVRQVGPLLSRGQTPLLDGGGHPAGDGDRGGQWLRSLRLRAAHPARAPRRRPGGGERWNLKNARFRHDHTPLDPSCPCPACTVHSRAYLHHLIKTDELLGKILLSLHNITQLVRFSTAMATRHSRWLFCRGFRSLEAHLQLHTRGSVRL